MWWGCKWTSCSKLRIHIHRAVATSTVSLMLFFLPTWLSLEDLKEKKCSLDQSRSSALTYIYDVIMYVFRSHLKVTPFNPLCLDDFFIYVIQLHPSLQAHGAGELGNWKGITTTGKATAWSDLSLPFGVRNMCCSVFFLKPKNPWTLQWKGLNLYSRGPGPQNFLNIFEGSGFLGKDIVLKIFSTTIFFWKDVCLDRYIVGLKTCCFFKDNFW